MSTSYWKRRYRDGGSSGDGSEGANAEYKAEFLNAFVRARGIVTVLEFGCGDGRQLALAEYPSYLGMDVSDIALELCRERFAGDPWKSFLPLLPRPYRGPCCDLVLSLDVIYHLIEDDVYEQHIRDVFSSSLRWVILYTTDMAEDPLSARHVRHRRVTQDVAAMFPEWTLVETSRNPRPELGGSDFYVYQLAA